MYCILKASSTHCDVLDTDDGVVETHSLETVRTLSKKGCTVLGSDKLAYDRLVKKGNDDDGKVIKATPFMAGGFVFVPFITVNAKNGKRTGRVVTYRLSDGKFMDAFKTESVSNSSIQMHCNATGGNTNVVQISFTCCRDDKELICRGEFNLIPNSSISGVMSPQFVAF